MIYCYKRRAYKVNTCAGLVTIILGDEHADGKHGLDLPAQPANVPACHSQTRTTVCWYMSRLVLSSSIGPGCSRYGSKTPRIARVWKVSDMQAPTRLSNDILDDIPVSYIMINTPAQRHAIYI